MSIISKDSVVIKQVKNFEKLNIDVILANEIEKNHTEINSAQKNQLEFGLNSKGKKITPKYASDDKGNETYAETKHALNPLPGFGTPDLLLSGDLQDNLDFDIGLDGDLFFFSNVDYFNSIEDRYKDAFGLTKKSIKKVMPKINNNVLKKIHKDINK